MPCELAPVAPESLERASSQRAFSAKSAPTKRSDGRLTGARAPVERARLAQGLCSVERWRIDYTHYRSRSSVGYASPAGFTKVYREAGWTRPPMPVPNVNIGRGDGNGRPLSRWKEHVSFFSGLIQYSCERFNGISLQNTRGTYECHNCWSR